MQSVKKIHMSVILGERTTMHYPRNGTKWHLRRAMKSATELAPRATNFATKKNTSHCNQPLGVPWKRFGWKHFRGPEIYRLNLDREQNTTVIRLETKPQRLQFQRHPAEMFPAMAHHKPLPKQTQAKSFLDAVMTTQDMNHQLANPLKLLRKLCARPQHGRKHIQRFKMKCAKARSVIDFSFDGLATPPLLRTQFLNQLTDTLASQLFWQNKRFFLTIIAVALLAHQISFMSFLGGTVTCCLTFPLTRSSMRFLRNTLMSRRHISLVQGRQEMTLAAQQLGKSMEMSSWSPFPGSEMCMQTDLDGWTQKWSGWK